MIGRQMLGQRLQEALGPVVAPVSGRDDSRRPARDLLDPARQGARADVLDAADGEPVTRLPGQAGHSEAYGARSVRQPGHFFGRHVDECCQLPPGLLGQPGVGVRTEQGGVILVPQRLDQDVLGAVGTRAPRSPSENRHKSASGRYPLAVLRGCGSARSRLRSSRDLKFEPSNHRDTVFKGSLLAGTARGQGSPRSRPRGIGCRQSPGR